MSKRLRSDSLDAATAPQIPRVLTVSLKSETPEIGKATPHRRATRGVESVRIDEGADRNAVMRDTILRLHQGGRRVVTDPIVLQGIDGSNNMTFEWLLDYQVREKLESREPEPDNLWKPAQSDRTQSPGMHPHRSSVTSVKQSQARKLLSTLLGDGETIDDPIVIDDAEGVVPSTRHHPVNDPGPSGTSRVSAQNPADHTGIIDRDGPERHHRPTNYESEDSDSEEEEPDSGAIDEESDADRNARPLPHPAFSPQLLPALVHDRELSEEEILTNEAPPIPPPRKTGPPKGRKNRPETGRSGTAAAPRDSATGIARPSRKHIQLPLPPNGRARRLVCSPALDIWCAVTMRGDVQFINGIEHTKLSDLSMPGESHHHVEDACLVGNTLVIGYGAPDRGVETQIETLNLNEFVNENDRLFFRNALLHPPHCDRGISSLAPVDNRRFLSGGYDKRIHLWTLSSNDSVKTNDMTLYTNAPARAIGYAPETKTAYIGSGRRIWTLKLEKSANTEGLPISSEVNSIHVNLHEPDLVVLEVDDLDEQVQLFDIRAGGFQTQPAVRFGHRTQANGSTRHSLPSSRYTRGSLSHCYFARGFADGYVFAWDFRNPRKVAVKLECRDGKQNVVHTAISGLDVAAFSTGVVTIYDQVL